MKNIIHKGSFRWENWRLVHSGFNRVLILDWDVHHGQGTQYAFYDTNKVLYISTHRYEHGNFWPNLLESDFDAIGEGDGKGFNVNIPLNKVKRKTTQISN